MRNRFLTLLMVVTFAIVGMNLSYAQNKGSNNNMTGSKSKTHMTKSDSSKTSKSGKRHHKRSSKKSSNKNKTENSNSNK